MIRQAGILLGALGALLVAAPASAQVIYTGKADFDGLTAGFNFTLPSYVTTDTLFTGAQTHCTASGGIVCTGVRFNPNGAGSDIVNIIFDPATTNGEPPAISGSFANGAFTTPGGYKSAGLVNALTVTAAPEAATWALMILGFGITGAALRRRRRAAQALALA